MKIGWTLIVLTALLTIRADAQKPDLQYRWVYVAQNLQVDANVEKVELIMRRAKAAGYNGMVFADYKLSVLDIVPDRYFANFAKVQATAKELGIEIIPAAFPIGYSGGLLAHDPNLAEGMPVRDALFVVKGDTAQLVPDPPVALRNGDFGEHDGDKILGWGFQDYPGASTFVDTTVRHEAAQSLRMENIGRVDPENGHCRVMQTVKVAPYRQYHLSVWIRSEDFDTPSDARVAILTTEGRALSYIDLGVQRTQDWKQAHVVFNSLSNSDIRVYLGVWEGKGGKLWWSEPRLEEIGLLNVLRRGGCPVIVKGEDGTIYEEGRDYEPIKDPRLGNVPWPGSYEVCHEAPAIALTPDTRIHDGERLRVSFYHPITIYSDQVMVCLSEPKVYDVLRAQIKAIDKLMSPTGIFMSHDEIRVANWCALCQSRKITAGQLLADNMQRCVEIVRDENPNAKLFVWSDMFDPNHNAVANYYLVNGTLAESWKGLPKDVIVVNWYYDKRKQSLPFFADLGNAQILAGYYDHDPKEIRTWLDDAKDVRNIVGVMYTTWQNRYDDLEAFAQAAWGE